MSIYLSYINKTQFTQQIVETPAFQAKHKITINKPAQAHYTVEGVQAYSPQEIKALKVREDRVSNQAKQGTFVSPKVVLLSDQIIEFEEGDPCKQDKEKVKQIVKPNTSAKNRNKQKVKINPRNALSANNQTITKLEKDVAKKNVLQKKLQKMSTKYKQFFKDVDLKQGFKKSSNNIIDHQQQQHKEQDNQNLQESERNQQKQQQINDSSLIKYDQTTYHSSKKSKSKGKKKINVNQKQGISEQMSQSSNSKEDFLGLGIDLVGRCSTYSEKLGTAIHQMFK